MRYVVGYVLFLIGITVVSIPLKKSLETKRVELEISDQGYFTNPFRRYTPQEMKVADKIQDELRSKFVLEEAEEALV